MKHQHFAIAAVFAFAAFAAGATPCDTVKEQIDARIKGHGVKAYILDAVATADVKDQKVVGSCEGGKKKIVYKRS